MVGIIRSTLFLDLSCGVENSGKEIGKGKRDAVERQKRKKKNQTKPKKEKEKTKKGCPHPVRTCVYEREKGMENGKEEGEGE